MSELDLLRMIQGMQRDIDILKTRDRVIGGTGAVLRYYLQNTASDIATYKKMLISVYTPKTTLSTAGLGAGNTTLQNFATDPNIPSLSFIPEGELQFHIHAAKTAGTKSAIIFAEIWEVTSAGVDVAKIGTTESTPSLAGTETEYTLAAILAAPYVMAGTTSRIVARVICTVSGGGSAPTVAIYYGVGADSHVELPSNTVDASNFVPYVGAQANVNLGAHTLSEAAGKDIFPDADGRGTQARITNRLGIATYTDHFRSGAIPAGYAWQGAPFAAPSVINYSSSSDYLLTYSTVGAQRSFLSKAVANNNAAWDTKSIYIRTRGGQQSSSGVRIDDGTDNNYVEYVMRGNADGTHTLCSNVRTGGGAVVTTATALMIPVTEFITFFLVVVNPGAPNHYTILYAITEDGDQVYVSQTPNFTWLPAAGRVGLIRTELGSFDHAASDWFYTTF